LRTSAHSDLCHEFGTSELVAKSSHIFHQSPPVLVVSYRIFRIRDLYGQWSDASL
jgi:hypothetical protein